MTTPWQHKTTGPKIVHVIDAKSFEMDETLYLPSKYNIDRGTLGTNSLFFDPSGRSMYAELDGALYEWVLQRNRNEGPEWWLGEE